MPSQWCLRHHCRGTGVDPRLNMPGNSVLIELTENKYMFVGWCIYTFETDDQIIDFVTPVGNNDVPYPIAYGEKNVYFMLDKSFVKKSKMATPMDAENCYMLYVEFYHIYTGVRHPMKNPKEIHERSQF